MAEPSKCPYCHIGIPLWIFVEGENRYILQCSHCSASGNYQAAQPVNAADVAKCPEHGYPINSTGLYYECLCPV